MGVTFVDHLWFLKLFENFIWVFKFSDFYMQIYITYFLYILVIMVLICYNCELRTRCVLNFLLFLSWYWGLVGYLYPKPKTRNYWIDPEENLVTIISLCRAYIRVWGAISHETYASFKSKIQHSEIPHPWVKIYRIKGTQTFIQKYKIVFLEKNNVLLKCYHNGTSNWK